MRASTAFFTGIGTVVLAIGGGLGGGLMIANIMTQEPKQASKLERRASPEAPPSTKDPLVPVPYLAETQASSSAAIVVPPAEQKSPDRQNEANSSSPQSTPPAASPRETTTSNEQAATSTDASKSDAPRTPKTTEASTAKSSEPAVQAAAAHEPDDAQAKARDSDLKRDADSRRAERRKAERRQQWADRRRSQPSREQELRGVEQSVRDDSEVRVYRDRAYRDEGEEPVRFEFPRIRLFGPED
jgi:hypothetical protein